jgi:hypothetical protein
MPKKKKLEAAQKVPSWATAHFKSVVDATEMLGRLIHISEKGIAVLRGMPRIVKVLADVEGASADLSTQKKLETAEREAALAQSEVDRDFPVLHGLAVVALWSQLEHFIKGLIVLWLLHRKDAMNVPAVQKLKIRLGDYMQLSRPEQARYLVELIEQDIAAPLKRGVSRFDSLLEPFSLSGSIAKSRRSSYTSFSRCAT